MKNLTFISITILVVILILVFIFWDNLKLLFAPQVPPAGVAGSAGASGKPVAQKQTDGTYSGITGTGLNGTMVLKSGSIGPEVLELQTMMNLTHQADLVTDGKFGPATLDALKSEAGVSSITLNQAWAAIYVPWNNTPQVSGTSATDNADGTATDSGFWSNVKNGMAAVGSFLGI